MKDRTNYWKNLSDKDAGDINFSFDLFLQTLQLIAAHPFLVFGKDYSEGVDKLKGDLGTRMNMLFKHIYKILNSEEKSAELMTSSKSTKSKSRSPGSLSKQKAVLSESQDKAKRVMKDVSDVYIMSNRSDGSTKSSRAKHKNASQSRKSKKRRSTNLKKDKRIEDHYGSSSVSSLITWLAL